MKKQKPANISLFGNFGSTNPGNEATLLAVSSRLRDLFPECELCCICGFPENVIAVHGMRAVPCTVRSARIWNRDAPVHERVRQAVPGLLEEAREYVRAWRTLENDDLMIVPGTGLLTDAWGLSGWGPYGLLKWSLVARLRRCRLVFLSVGAGPVHGRLGRLLLRSALSLGSYRSYRDVPSKEIVESLGLSTRGDPIYPDLVFGLSPAMTVNLDDRREERPVVGLGLMEYGAKYSTPSPTGDTYTRYLETLAVFAAWLLEHDYDIRILLGDADTVVIDDFRKVLRTHLGSHDQSRVTDPTPGSIDAVLAQLGATDFVVATRFHNVLMSLLLGKVPIAISFHHKVKSLMSEMGLSDYCHDINQMNADVLIGQFRMLVQNTDKLKPAVAHRVAEARRALDEQYQLLFEVPAEKPRLDKAIVPS